jgi:predicted ribosome quality control (RQC) complex YloA/Tae2 family protein
VEKSREQLKKLDGDSHWHTWADLIMANLQLIKKGSERFKAEGFDGQPVDIPLKKNLNAQQNAEAYYHKGKNIHREVQVLKEALLKKENELAALQLLKLGIESATDVKSLRHILHDAPEAAEQPSLPYREIEFHGFTIRIGKNAAANDELTLKYSFKEDLWLHAKDVAGSHVLIKHRAGKPFPNDVIERAAELAAYYSKRKNDSLCPVAVTPKKFVRKRKGDPDGAVVVEREKVLLVKPAP